MQDNRTDFTLLLVDDNPTNLFLVSRIIELDLPAVRVLTARSGAEGLELAAAHPIDGAFIDVQMPQMDGLEMCRRLKLDPRTARIPLVLMTAHVASPQMRAAGLDVGAYDFISQPISNVEMLARIKVMLRLCENERLAAGVNSRLQHQIEEHSTRLRWISGLLISGAGGLTPTDQDWLKRLAAGLPLPSEADDQAFFDQLVTDLPMPWQRTLLKLALLDRIPLPLAGKLSEISDISAGLEYLKRHQLMLVERDGQSEYLLFQPRTTSLLRRRSAELLSETERQEVYRIAADWYRERGPLAAVVHCLVHARRYDEVSQLLSQQGLAPASSQADKALFDVLEWISDETAAECGWLSLYRGIRRLNLSEPDARVWLELAVRQFDSRGDRRGRILAQSRQILLFVFVDGSREIWKSRYDRFREEGLDLLPGLDPVDRLELIFCLGLAGLFFDLRLTEIQELLSDGLAEAQQLQLSEQFARLNLLRARLALIQGRALVMKTAFEQAQNAMPDDISQLDRMMISRTAYALLRSAGTLSGLRRQQQLLSRTCPVEVQRRTSTEALFGYYCAGLLAARGELRLAEQEIEMALVSAKAVGSIHLQSFLVQLRGLIRARQGDRGGAGKDLSEGLTLRLQAGSSLCRLENLVLAGATAFVLDEMDQAQAYLTEALEGSQRIEEEHLRVAVHAWLAVVCRHQGRTGLGDQHLGAFFDLLRRQQILYFCGLTPELVKELMSLVSSVSEKTLLEDLVRKYLQVDPEHDNQPVEFLDIDTLGGFVVRRKERCYDLRRIGQASRLILAHLLMAQHRSVSIDVLMGRLWPDSSPSKARNNFDSAHSRLRKGLEDVFGDNVRRNYLVLEKGMVSLHHVRVDARRFVEGVEKARYYLQREHFWQAEQQLWKMDRLWQGPFLQGHDLDDELFHFREELSRLRFEQLGLLAGLAMRRHSYPEACALLQAGLTLDPTEDSLVRQLLTVYREQGDHRSAELLLEQYRTALENNEYEKEEIDELIDALDGQWLGLTGNRKRKR